jgi:hypothetical protein
VMVGCFDFSFLGGWLEILKNGISRRMGVHP